jgi:hypothetical protein
MTDQGPRNARVAERIGATTVSYPFSFVMAGDSGAWPDPMADHRCRVVPRAGASLLRPPGSTAAIPNERSR